jgi:hypothetical protein
LAGAVTKFSICRAERPNWELWSPPQAQPSTTTGDVRPFEEGDRSMRKRKFLDELLRMLQDILDSPTRTIHLCLLLAVATTPLGIVAATVYLVDQ